MFRGALVGAPKCRQVFRDIAYDQWASQRIDMAATVTIETENGSSTYTGHIVCRGPGTMEMLLTQPFGLAGRTVQFPVRSVVEERPEPDPSPDEEPHGSTGG